MDPPASHPYPQPWVPGELPRPSWTRCQPQLPPRVESPGAEAPRKEWLCTATGSLGTLGGREELSGAGWAWSLARLPCPHAQLPLFSLSQDHSASRPRQEERVGGPQVGSWLAGLGRIKLPGPSEVRSRGEFHRGGRKVRVWLKGHWPGQAKIVESAALVSPRLWQRGKPGAPRSPPSSWSLVRLSPAPVHLPPCPSSSRPSPPGPRRSSSVPSVPPSCPAINPFPGPHLSLPPLCPPSPHPSIPPGPLSVPPAPAPSILGSLSCPPSPLRHPPSPHPSIPPGPLSVPLAPGRPPSLPSILLALCLSPGPLSVLPAPIHPPCPWLSSLSSVCPPGHSRRKLWGQQTLVSPRLWPKGETRGSQPTVCPSLPPPLLAVPHSESLPLPLWILG